MLAQPGVDVALDHWPATVGACRLAVGHAHAAHLEARRLGEKLPEGGARRLHVHAVQVEAALEGDLPGLELAHLAFLHAVAHPVQLVLGADVDDEQVGQPVDRGGLLAEQRVLLAVGDLLAIGLGFAGVGALLHLDALDSAHLAEKLGKIVVCHTGSPRQGGHFNGCGGAAGVRLECAPHHRGAVP
ncbi:hypothetical protein D3C81_1723020 [compost metagenome]